MQGPVLHFAYPPHVRHAFVDSFYALALNVESLLRPRCHGVAIGFWVGWTTRVFGVPLLGALFVWLRYVFQRHQPNARSALRKNAGAVIFAVCVKPLLSRHRHWSFGFVGAPSSLPSQPRLLLFSRSYPGVTSLAFSVFNCRTLGPGDSEEWGMQLGAARTYHQGRGASSSFTRKPQAKMRFHTRVPTPRAITCDPRWSRGAVH